MIHLYYTGLSGWHFYLQNISLDIYCIKNVSDNICRTEWHTIYVLHLFIQWDNYISSKNKNNFLKQKKPEKETQKASEKYMVRD